jgi:hypothetical protein
MKKYRKNSLCGDKEKGYGNLVWPMVVWFCFWILITVYAVVSGHITAR